MYLQKIKLMGKTHVIVIDLDNTLLALKSNRVYTMGTIDIDNLKMRPYAIQLLCHLYSHFDIILFTTGTKEYAESCLLTYFSQVKHMFAHVLSRKHSVDSDKLFGAPKHSEYVQLFYKKKKHFIGVDDLGSINMDQNFVKIYAVKPYYGATNDCELKRLWELIKSDFKLVRNYRK
jgi:NLI interacting factor-like phosphatase